MLTITQAVGLLVAIFLTIMFILIGYQVVLILQEVKKSAEKVNRILDDAVKVTDSVSEPIVSFSGFVSGLKDGARLMNLFMGDHHSSNKDKDHRQPDQTE